MLGSRAVRACMSKSSTSAFDFAYSSLARRGAPNCIRMNPRNRCASGMLGSSSTVYNEQPTSAEMLPSRARTEIGYEANIQQFDQNPTYKRVCRAHPRAYGERSLSCRVVGSIIGSPPRIRGTQVGSSQRIDANRLTPAHTGKTAHRQVVPASPPSTFATPAKAPLGGPPPPRRQAAHAR